MRNRCVASSSRLCVALRMAMACHAMLGNMEAAQKLWPQVALLSPSDRVSEIRKRAPSGEIKTLRSCRKPIASPECRNEDDAPPRCDDFRFWRKPDFRKLAACLSEAEVDRLNSVE